MKIDDTNILEAVWLDHNPGNRVEYDQVKAMAVDAVRDARHAIVLAQDNDGENALVCVADGVVTDAAQFFLDSAFALVKLAAKAAGLTPLEVCAHVLHEIVGDSA